VKTDSGSLARVNKHLHGETLCLEKGNHANLS